MVNNVQCDTGNDNNGKQLILREAIHAAIYSLGDPIYKTITWHMNNRGVFSGSKDIDINNFYSNLQDLVGPGADMIMEMTWELMKKKCNVKPNFSEGGSTAIDKIKKIMGMTGRMA